MKRQSDAYMKGGTGLNTLGKPPNLYPLRTSGQYAVNPAGNVPSLASPDLRKTPAMNLQTGGELVGDIARRALEELRSLGRATEIDALAGAIATALVPMMVSLHDAMRYATFQSFGFTMAGGDQLILEKPVSKRVYLAITNLDAANNMTIAFDRPAQASDWTIFFGGGAFEWLFLIPQNDIHINAIAGTVGALIYAELPLPKATT